MGVWLNKDDYIRDLKRIILCFLIVYMAILVGTDQDFYSLLGVSKTASSREIRQAFKKLALKLHPDKNPNNPNAHGDFLKINRAYEVLKDEDLRKKYDKYGEKGLEDNQGGQYESWNYYRYDFGIYDDDPEIITLERREFDAAVNSGELWFVNFYSPGCSHCHDLAPTWRDFAKEVDGLLRIGAVNCGDDRMLCRMKGVNSYPSLFIFRSGMAPVKYHGDRSKESLVSFTMQHVRSTVTELWTGNFVNAIQTAFAAGIGWLITFCSKGGDCLTSQTRLRLSGMLFLNSLDAKEIYLEVIHNLPDFELLSANTLEDRLAHHRWFDCSSAPDICSNLYVFQPSLAVFKGQGTKEYEIHHGKKILYDILAFAKESVNSHVTTLGPQNFPANDKEPWLVDFFAPWCPPCRALLPELRRASNLLYGQLKFGTLDCTVHEGLCNMYNIQAYPTTVVFNQSNIHEYEGHHSAEQILEFIEDLMNPSVVSLTPTTFNELVTQRKHNEVWMVDFYSPWCHPCQVLMPEWKRMARTLTGLINVGSIDCQQYHSFCAQENVQRYPEIRFFPPKSNKAYQYHSYNGWNRDAYSLRIWVSTDLTPQTFKFELLARMIKGKVKAGKVDCQAYAQTCQKAGIRAYPTVKFYFYERAKRNFQEEQINTRDAKAIAALINEKLETLQNQGKRNKVWTKPRVDFGKS
uniref:DnaJ homolog subfamily C member 10 n=1 Tax=Rhinopithecus bieti TaxID=61621 RepID=A0A2K6L8C7_RHIBE